MKFTSLERPAIYGVDNKDSISYKKGGVKAPSSLTGFAKFDVIGAALIGESAAWLGLLISTNLKFTIPFFWIFPIFLPALAVLGIYASFLISRKILIIFQAAKFILAGSLTTLLDLGILNFLILVSGTAAGLNYSIFKGISFIAAVINSYFWNKFWIFRKSTIDEVGRPTQILQRKIMMSREFFHFFTVSIIGFGINVGIASLAVNIIGSQFNLEKNLLGNVGAIVATLVATIWNFLGYKFIVFKK